jgi:hypothetical protein
MSRWTRKPDAWLNVPVPNKGHFTDDDWDEYLRLRMDGCLCGPDIEEEQSLHSSWCPLVTRDFGNHWRYEWRSN